MLLSRLPYGCKLPTALVLLFALATLASCTVEPLNASRPSSEIGTQSTREILASTTVNRVHKRVDQQVRNNLLFAMNGGKLQPGGRYSVNLEILSQSRKLAIENSSRSPTSAQVAITATYKLIENSSQKVVASGKRRALAGYDRTPQSFANERAERDAQNRAAKEVAQQVRLALAQALADL